MIALASIAKDVRRRTVAYQVRWRENGVSRSKNFPTLAEAKAFRAEVHKLWPKVTPGPDISDFPSLKQRILLSITEDPSGCWLWAKRINQNGYGQLMVRDHGGAKQRSRGAHRVSYEQFVGPIPEGLELDHLCRVRKCVNPAHLEPVTHQENLRRSPLHPARQRPDGQCSNGHVLAEVGIHKAGTGTTCAQCSRDRTRRFRAKNAERRARLAAQGGGER